MTLSQAGALVSRAIGTFLIINGAAFWARIIMSMNLANGGPVGWSGAPPSSSSSFINQTALLGFSMVLLPQLMNLVMGFLMIYFSRVAGRWLTKGLAENDYE